MDNLKEPTRQNAPFFYNPSFCTTVEEQSLKFNQTTMIIKQDLIKTMLFTSDCDVTETSVTIDWVNTVDEEELPSWFVTI